MGCELCSPETLLFFLTTTGTCCNGNEDEDDDDAATLRDDLRIQLFSTLAKHIHTIFHSITHTLARQTKRSAAKQGFELSMLALNSRSRK